MVQADGGSRAARARLVAELRRELMGPSSPEETLDEYPTSRYVVGRLAPSGGGVKAKTGKAAPSVPPEEDDPLESGPSGTAEGEDESATGPRLELRWPISPMRREEDLRAIHSLVGASAKLPYRTVHEACERLRSLRQEACKALLSGLAAAATSRRDAGPRLADLLPGLKDRIEVREVIDVATGMAPRALIGCRVPEGVVKSYCDRQ